MAYNEGHRLIYLSQEGLRQKKNSTKNALIRLVQTIADGLNEDKTILEWLVDLTNEYD